MNLRPARASSLPQRPWNLGRALVLLFFVLSTAGAGSTWGAAPAPIDRFVGQWDGVGADMAMTLRLSATGETTLQGEVQFFGFERRRNAWQIAQQPRSWYRVEGTYDPALLTFELAPTDWVEQPRQHLRMDPIRGVFDPNRPGLAGVVDKPRGPAAGPPAYFVLARPNNASNLTRPLLGEPAQRVRARMPNEAGIIRWASRLKEEHPNLNPGRTLRHHFLPLAYNLFEDEYFRSHFGATYDQLNSSQRQEVRQHFRSRPSPEIREFIVLEGAFQAEGARNLGFFVPVMAQRVIRGWGEIQRTRLEAMQPKANTFEELAALAGAADAYFRPLWPSEWTGFRDVYTGSRERLAGPALAAVVDELVGREPGYDVAAALASWEEGREEALALVSDEQSAALRARVLARLDEVLEGLLADPIAALRGFGSGPGAVREGNRWYAELRERYAFAGERPPIRRAVEFLHQRRSHDLASAVTWFEERISRLRTTAEVREFIRTTLAVPGDNQTSSGQRLIWLADARTRDMDRAAYLARFSANERRLLGDGNRIAVGASYDPPDRHDIHRALLRAYVDSGGSWVDANTVGFTYVTFLFMMDLDITANVHELRVLNPDAGGRYEVEVSYGVRLATSGPIDQLAGPIFETINSLSGSQRATHIFELTPEGWKSPTFQQRVAQSLWNL